MTELCNPKDERWFICWDNRRRSITSYSSVGNGECLDTFWSEVDYYSDEKTWLSVLAKNGIIPD